MFFQRIFFFYVYKGAVGIVRPLFSSVKHISRLGSQTNDDHLNSIRKSWLLYGAEIAGLQTGALGAQLTGRATSYFHSEQKQFQNNLNKFEKNPQVGFTIP